MSTIDTSTPQLKAAQKWIDAYIALDMDVIDNLLPKCYKHQVFPKSIGLPEEMKEEYIQRLGGLVAALTESKITVHSVIEVPEPQPQLIIHATSLCSSIYGVSLTYEGIFNLSFVEEDGELKLSRCEEFIDSQEYATFVANASKVATVF